MKNDAIFTTREDIRAVDIVNRELDVPEEEKNPSCRFASALLGVRKRDAQRVCACS